MGRGVRHQVGNGAGNRQRAARALLQGALLAASCPAGTGAVGTKPGEVGPGFPASPAKAGPSSPAPGAICLHLPGPSQPPPGRGSLSGCAGQDRAHLGLCLGLTRPPVLLSPSSGTVSAAGLSPATAALAAITAPKPLSPWHCEAGAAWGSLSPEGAKASTCCATWLFWGVALRPWEQAGAGALPGIAGAMDCSTSCQAGLRHVPYHLHPVPSGAVPTGAMPG